MQFSIASAFAVFLAVASASPVAVPESLTELIARGASQTDINNSLAAHNAARAAVGEKALVWDTTLQAKAQAWADTLATTGALQHGSAGENLYWGSAATDHDLLLATQSWVNEKKNYHGEAIPDGDFNNYGHYSQVVWSNTQRVGMGATRDSKGGVYVVARYDPVGNYVGQKPY
ncbi:PR-1-like protein [Thozetella sp. PMI_491]|nr:PR-1-like protein [Thozetella sp. PMI_491]